MICYDLLLTAARPESVRRLAAWRRLARDTWRSPIFEFLLSLSFSGRSSRLAMTLPGSFEHSVLVNNNASTLNGGRGIPGIDLHWHITCCLNKVDDLRLYTKSGSIEKLPSLSHGMDRSRCHFLLSFRSFRRATRAAIDREPASEPGGPGWAGRYLLCRGFRFADFGLSGALQRNGVRSRIR